MTSMGSDSLDTGLKYGPFSLDRDDSYTAPLWKGSIAINTSGEDIGVYALVWSDGSGPKPKYRARLLLSTLHGRCGSAEIAFVVASTPHGALSCAVAAARESARALKEALGG